MVKKENVNDGILPQFAALLDLLLEVDTDQDFYGGKRLATEDASPMLST